MIKTDVTIRGGGYEASFRSDLGGNCYRLVNEGLGADILRHPEDEEQLFSEIFLFGNAILFPPNRISGASFEFEGRKYVFPLNERSTGCHLHGELYKTRFEVEELSESSVTFSYECRAGEYLGFPHAFRIRRIYTLDERGLTECTEMCNLSGLNMPYMLAFHTTFNLPFVCGGEGASLKMPVGREQLRNEKYLPTGEYAKGRERERALSDGSYRLSQSAVSALYESAASDTVITDEKTGRKIVYSASNEYGYRLLWQRVGGAFVVTEPQTSAIDLFHLDTPPSENGLIVIPPNSSVRTYTAIRVE